MGFISNNLLKVIEWQDNSRDTLVYKFPMDGRQIMNGSKLTVRESQVAIFVNNGKVADIFEPGMYKLETSNLPILTQLLSWPYGFKSPFYAEVYFINTKQFTNLKWGTSNPIPMRDKDFGTVRIRGYGTYAFKVDNPKMFLEELFGTNSSFSTNDIKDYLKSMLVSTITDTIAESKVSALDMASNLLEFGDNVKEVISEKFVSLGLKLTNFVLENLSFPEEVEKAIDKRSSLGVMSDQMDTYMKYKAANALEEAAKNTSDGNMASTGIGIGAGISMANAMKDMYSNTTVENQTNFKEEKKAKVKYCSECGSEMSYRSKFCPECGHKQTTEGLCPECGAKVTPGAKFCSECGHKLG